MLVLSRKVGERIRINDDITIELLEINGRQCRFGIVAPRNVPVHREEVFQLIQAEKSIVELGAMVG